VRVFLIISLALTGCEGISNKDLDGDGWTRAQGDCDDLNPERHPEAEDQVGDAYDQDCDEVDGVDADGDGVASVASGGEDCWDDDASRAGIPTWYADSDGDDYGQAGTGTQACEASEGQVDNDDDCDDTERWVFPGAPEACNGVDDDCNGEIDDGFAMPSWYADSDGDGYGDPDSGIEACEAPDGMISDRDDCDDADASVHPGAEEWCDGVDNDCDGQLDDASAQDALRWYLDQDGDGYGSEITSTMACEQPSGFAADSGDCDDEDATVHPDAEDVWYDGIDSDCDGWNDYDQDMDGSRHEDHGGRDCDDLDATVGPYMTDTWYDGVDSDCDGWSDYDQDLDGHDADAYGGDDCDDTRDYLNPGSAEACNFYDDDCDGLVDGDDPDFEPVCFADDDGDGWGDPDAPATTCTCASGWVQDSSDCDDGDSRVNPLAADANGDGVDDDCDGLADDERWLDEADYGLLGATSLDWAGSAVASAGDVNADGHPDLLIGAPGLDGASSNAGGAYLVLGPVTAGVTLTAADSLWVGLANGDDAGSSVAGVGDVNGDGFDDVLIGAPYDDSATTNAGAAYLQLGPVTGTASLIMADVVLLGETSADEAGWDVAAAGDVDGDGLADLIIGAPQASGSSWVGAAYLVLGPATSLSDLGSADARLLGSEGHSGYAVDGGGDVNGDGLADMLIGAPDHTMTGYAEGAAYLVLGPATGDITLASSAQAELLGVAQEDYAGISVAFAGDVDADGYDDVLVGAYCNDDGGEDAGIAYLLTSFPTGTVDLGTAEVLIVGEHEDDLAGSSVEAAGDVNGDGNADILVGATGEDSGGGGAVYLLHGSIAGTISLGEADAKWIGEGYVGWAMAGVGDIDADGLDDLLLGDEWDDTSGSNAGAAWLVLGGSL
jgi:hypothetical protein